VLYEGTNTREEAGPTETRSLRRPGKPRQRRPMSGVRKAVLGLAICGLVLLLGVVGGAFYIQQHLSGQLGRIDGAFNGLKNRPSRPTTGPASHAVNILLMGTDRRSDVPTTGTAARANDWVPGLQRSDTLMLLHVNGNRKGATVVSIPRDSWVDVPGYGPNKINAAFSLGGPSLAVATVERLTGVRIDHLAVVDWTGFRELTNWLGGVRIYVPATVTDTKRHITWTKGEHTLNGQQALTYVGQRYGLPQGDLDRTRRQQNFLRALIGQASQDGVFRDPRKLYSFLDTLTRHLSVDSGWSVGDMRGLLLSARGIRFRNITYLNAPVRGFGYEGLQSVVYLDRLLNRSLWKAVRDDHVHRWVGRLPTLVTGHLVS
jgi:LCP family protein required for cell wall assembly